MSGSIWGRHYGEARKKSWRALRNLAVAALAFIFALTLADVVGWWPLKLGVLIGGVVLFVVVVVEYIRAEIRAVKAMILDDKEK